MYEIIENNGQEYECGILHIPWTEIGVFSRVYTNPRSIKDYENGKKNSIAISVWAYLYVSITYKQ